MHIFSDFVVEPDQCLHGKTGDVHRADALPVCCPFFVVGKDSTAPLDVYRASSTTINDITRTATSRPGEDQLVLFVVNIHGRAELDCICNCNFVFSFLVVLCWLS